MYPSHPDRGFLSTTINDLSAISPLCAVVDFALLRGEPTVVGSGDSKVITDFILERNRSSNPYKVTEMTVDHRTWLGERIVAAYGFASLINGKLQLVPNDDLRAFLADIVSNEDASALISEISSLSQSGFEVYLVKYRLTADGRSILPKLYVRGDHEAKLGQCVPVRKASALGNLNLRDVELIGYFMGRPEVGAEAYFHSNTVEMTFQRNLYTQRGLPPPVRAFMRECLTRLPVLGPERSVDYLSSSLDISAEGEAHGFTLYYTLSDFRAADQDAYDSLMAKVSPLIVSEACTLSPQFKPDIVAIKERNAQYGLFPSWSSVYSHFLSDEYF